jgi:hypothetical protein
VAPRRFILRATTSAGRAGAGEPAIASRDKIPLGLKLAYTAWVAVWLPIYWHHHGPQNLLWFCDLANLVALLAIWRGSPLLLSSQLVAVGVPQVGWTVDYLGRLISGSHPLGGTEYMFDATQPFWLRALSYFHFWMLPLLAVLVARVGYDRRGWWLQSAIAAMVLPLSMLIGTREENLNWVWGPFGIEQTWMPPWVWVACLVVLYPLVLFLPTHLLAAWMLPRCDRGALARPEPLAV